MVLNILCCIGKKFRSILRKNIYLQILIIIILILACGKDSVQHKIYLIFRFDDVSAMSSKSFEKRIINLMQCHNYPLTLSIIPFINSEGSDLILEDETLKLAAEQDKIEIALHGYIHKKNGYKYDSEFAGDDYDTQFNKISEGKKLLEMASRKEVITFVPPWGTYDENTLFILEKLKFQTIGTDPRIEHGNYISSLNFLPHICGPLQVRNAVMSARKSAQTDTIILIQFHEYDFKEINANSGIVTFREFSNLLKWISNQEDVQVLSIDQASKVVDLSMNRFMLNSNLYSILNRCPKFISEYFKFQYLDYNSRNLILLWAMRFFVVFIYFGLAFLIIFSLYKIMIRRFE